MKRSKILIYPNENLFKKAKEVTSFDKNLKNLAYTMFGIMKEHNGIGLAAPQIGISQRIFVMDTQEEKKHPNFFINPIIEESNGEISYEEGCLSIPNIRAFVKRKNNLTLSYYDIIGKKQKLKATELMAVCIQHEIDHLDGTLFIDRLSPLKKKLILEKLKNVKKN